MVKAWAGFFLLAIGSVSTATQPLPKTGPCPAGYAASGAYCKPGKLARFAVEKHGGCPSGWQASGNYCLGER